MIEQRTCIKGLYKSTYKRNAFVKGRKYEVVEVGDNFVWVKDEMGHRFSFVPTADGTHYSLNDHFGPPIVYDLQKEAKALRKRIKKVSSGKDLQAVLEGALKKAQESKVPGKLNKRQEQRALDILCSMVKDPQGFRVYNTYLEARELVLELGLGLVTPVDGNWSLNG